MKHLLQIILSFSIISLHSWAQQPGLRGMYVDNFSNILGNTAKEDSLLQYAADSSFNYLSLYDLHVFNLANTATANLLGGFINRAKTNYGIQHVGAVGESFSFFTNKILPYNNGRANSIEKISVFNVEFEFWIQASVQPGGYYCVNYLQAANCSCDTAGAFKYYKTLLRQVDSLANIYGMISETYVGWFNTGQAQQYNGLVDRIFVHAYRIDDSDVWTYTKSRLTGLASTGDTLQIVPIFSSEPTFMGPWLQAGHSITEPWTTYLDDYNNDPATWKPLIDLIGYQWFCYGFMPRPAPGSFNASITASGPTTFCQGGSVTLTATQGSSYVWSNGANTRSIIVNASGNYNCTVTNGAFSSTTSNTAVNVNPLPSVLVNAGTPANGQCNLSSTTSGNITSHQWLLNGNGISGATQNAYTATQSGGYSLRVTNNNNCSKVSTTNTITVPPFAPTITASGPTTFCFGGSVTLTATAGSSYIWSNGATTQSINAINIGNYSCTVTLGAATAQTNTVSITVNGLPNVNFTTSNPNNGLSTLTASATGTITSRQWFLNNVIISGATNNTYLASQSGSYKVQVTNSNGCTNTSAVQTLNIPAFAPSISASGNTNFCIGSTVTLTATNANSYLWNNGATSQSITVSTTGNYTCNVSNGVQTVSSNALNVVVNALPTASISNTTPSNGSATITANINNGGANIIDYQWFLDGNAISGANAAYFTAYQNGDYRLMVTNSNSCTGLSNTINLSFPNPCTLTIPNQLATPQVDDNSALIQWNNNSNTDSIIIRLQKEGYNDFTYYRFAFNGQTNLLIENLLPAHKYNWRIKTVCGNASSSYSSKQEFRTSGYMVYQHVDPNPYETRSNSDILIQHYASIDPQLNVYPNPVTAQFTTLTFTSDETLTAHLTIMDIDGRLISQQAIAMSEGENFVNIDASQLANGQYLIGLQGQNLSEFKKVVVAH